MWYSNMLIEIGRVFNIVAAGMVLVSVPRAKNDVWKALLWFQGLSCLMTFAQQIADNVPVNIFWRPYSVMEVITVVATIQAYCEKDISTKYTHMFFDVFIIFSLYINGWIEPTKSAEIYVVNIGNIIILLFLLYYFVSLMKFLNEPNLAISPMFWFVVGQLLYTTGTFFFFICFDSVIHNIPRSTKDWIWTINSFFATFRILCLIIALGIYLVHDTKSKKMQLSSPLPDNSR